MISECALAQAAAAAWLVKKFRYPQQIAADGLSRALAVRPMNAAAMSGFHTALVPSTATRRSLCGAPFEGGEQCLAPVGGC